MSKYVRLCKTVNTKGDIVPFIYDKIIEEVNKTPDIDWYTSLFSYDEEVIEYFSKNNSINGYKGKASLDALVFDFDSKDNIEAAKTDTIELLVRLQTKGITILKNVSIFFSGGKGFHVVVPLKRCITNDEMKSVCTTLAKGLDSFDPVIYNITRLFRIENTRHNKTGLYKIQITPQELKTLSVEDIKKLAVTTRAVVKPTPVEETEFLDDLINTKPVNNLSVIVDSNDIDGIRGIDDIDFANCPAAMPRCVYALTHGIMRSGKGERSEIFLRIAAYYKNQGMSKEAAFGALKGISRDNSRLYPEHDKFAADEIWNTVIQSVFGNTTWQTRPGSTGIDEKNETIKKYCEVLDTKTNIRCCLHHRFTKDTGVVNIQSVENSFDDFASNFDKNLVKTGINFIDDYMKIAVGTTTILAGACGSGKTSLCLNIMEHTNAADQHTMFFSLDMNKNLVYLKLAQKLTPYNQDQILQIYKQKDTEKMEKIKEAIAKKYSKTFFDFSPVLTIENMMERVISTEERNNCKIKLVVVDYASRVQSQYSDSYASARYNALKSVEAASVTDAAWIWLSQVSRASGDGSSPLRTKRVAKESGDWEESASNVITCWRPFMGKEGQDNVIRLFLAKNRMGSELERPLHWDGAKGSVTDMTHQEYEYYKQELEPLETSSTAAKKKF